LLPRLSLRASFGKIALITFILAFACLLFFSFYSYSHLERQLIAVKDNALLGRELFSVFVLTSASMGVFLILLYLIVSNRITQKRKAQEKKLEKSRRLYATVSQVNKMIIYAREADDLFRQLCSVIVDSGKFRMAWVGIIDQQNRIVVPACHAGHEDGYLNLIKVSLDPIPDRYGTDRDRHARATALYL
jgi:predicted membrane protein